MENKHKLALYVAYYLARFNEKALINLGYSNWSVAYSSIGNLLDVKELSIRNRRDEFDPLFGFRAGWYKRPMSPSRIKVVQALEDLDEPEILGLVKDILFGKINEEPDEKDQLLAIVTDDKKIKRSKKFILRSPTGKAAEEYFIQEYKNGNIWITGELSDCRDLGCGYDFKITNKQKNIILKLKDYQKLREVFCLQIKNGE